MFDKKKYIESCKPAVEKLLKELESKKISFTPMDGELENVIFKQENKELKIAHRCFYRISGMCVYYKEKPGTKKGQTFVEAVPISTEDYITKYQKSLILNYFNKQKK